MFPPDLPTVQIEIHPDLASAIRALAKERDTTPRQLIEHALYQYNGVREAWKGASNIRLQKEFYEERRRIVEANKKAALERELLRHQKQKAKHLKRLGSKPSTKQYRKKLKRISRAQVVISMRETNSTFAEIGKRLKISRARADQIYREYTAQPYKPWPKYDLPKRMAKTLDRWERQERIFREFNFKKLYYAKQIVKSIDSTDQAS
jgi:hypothetical protein